MNSLKGLGSSLANAIPWGTEDPDKPVVKFMAAPNSLTTPHNASLSKTMEPGETMIVQGVAHEMDKDKDGKESDQRITINLAAGKNGYNCATIPLQLAIRFNEKEISYNSKKDGEWGKEEKTKIPFKAGEHFDIRIRAQSDKFTIYMNGVVHHEFEHRLPLSAVDHVFVDGRVNLEEAKYAGKYYTMPFVTGFEGGLGTGKTLILSAVPSKNAEAFEICLKTADNDIALKFNPQFKKKEVIRNAKKGGVFGNDEKEAPFPFKAERLFDMVIVNEPYSFQIFVDNFQLCSFAHRMEPGSVNSLEIQGDLEVHTITVEGK